MNLPALALRNLVRHRRRALVTGLAIAFGALAVVCLQGFVNSFVAHLRESSVLSGTGAVQIHRRGYLGATDPLRWTFADDPALVARIRATPGVTAVAPRLKFDGLISNGADGTLFVATAIDPEAEGRVSPLRAERIADGGRALGPADVQGAVAGKALADALGAELGDTLVVQAAGRDGVPNALDVTVQAFLPAQTDPHVSKRLITIPLGLAQQLLRLPGQLTEYAVAVESLDDVERVATALRRALGPEYEVTTWRQVDVSTSERTLVLQAVLVFVALILMLLVATGILNTMMMSVYERVREIGTLLALGVRRAEVRALFLWEAFWLGLVSGAGGVLAGRGLTLAIAAGDVRWQAPGGEWLTLRPEVGGGALVAVLLFAIGGTALAGLLPAWRASRLSPIEALRSN